MDVAVYLALRQHSPAPYACLMRQHGRTVISHSPECFIQGSGSGSAAQIRSEPIKGTRRRQPGYEAAVVAELLASAKDRAELAMIVDLVRNDLGRVARPGSVSVREAARVMDLDYVHHLVATVEACCEPADHQALLAAAFPPGSITGAPKIAAMELIAQLETGPRGPYCGTFGWLGADGACALAVAIRTMVIEADGQLALHAGGGIVADSDGESEWAEVLAKADRMLHSLGAGL
jgi:para-aminobenzoate synthetase component 1